MNIRDMNQLLKRMREDADLLKNEVTNEVNDGRLLLDPKLHQQFAKDMEAIASDVGVAEVQWRKFERTGSKGKKFSAVSN